jgi:hypothetical protein
MRMAEAIYVLCAATSLGCAFLLLRGYRRSRARLPFFTALFFAIFAINNVLLPVDMIAVPDVDLSLFRTSVALAAMVVLLFGLVWESR